MSVLSYYNSCLQLDDVKLLRDKEWLNDKIISFMFEFFEYEKFKDLSEEIAFISPEVSQLVKLTKSREEIGLFLEPLEQSMKKVIFFVVNNNESVSAGGTHWSLLVNWNGIFQHYDSASNLNNRNALNLAQKVHSCVKPCAPFQFVSVDCPQQSNSYDCGIYVIAFCEMLCLSYKRDKSLVIDADINVSCRRAEILCLIDALKKR